VELKNLCCQSLSELKVELRKAKEHLRHKRDVIDVILGCIRQPGFEVYIGYCAEISKCTPALLPREHFLLLCVHFTSTFLKEIFLLTFDALEYQRLRLRPDPTGLRPFARQVPKDVPPGRCPDPLPSRTLDPCWPQVRTDVW
jgi:hypothetical protein